MNVFRRFLSRSFAAGWLAAALAAGLTAHAQEESQNELIPGVNTNAASASKPKVKARAAVQRKVSIFDEDEPAAGPPREVIEPYHEPHRGPNRGPNHEAHREVHRGPQRPAAYGFGGPRPVPSAYMPRMGKTERAMYQDDPMPDPMPEALPAPQAPMGMGPPAESVGPPPIVRGPRGRRMLRQQGGPMVMGDEFEGEIPFGGDPFTSQDGGCASCEGGGCAECDGGFVPGAYRDCFPCLFLTMRNLDISSGVHGFTNSTNRGGSGSFGYHIGVNKGMPMPCLPCSNLSLQLGVSGVFSNFDGGTFSVGQNLATTFDNRNQLFFTGGVFRRVDWGLQGGVVIDYLHDDWYATLDMTQIRGELSWVYPNCHELGFWFATSVNTDTQTGNVQIRGRNVQVVEGWEPADLYAFFYRYRFPETCGSGRFFGGFSGDGDGLVGGDFWVPLNNNWSVQSDYTYLIPRDTQGVAGNQNEAWNLSINFVWSPGACRNYGPNYDRPLLNVANNGSFIVKRRIPPSTP